MKEQLLSNQFIFELEQRMSGELQAEFMYRQLSAIAQNLGYFGASSFFKNEAEQEVKHFTKLVDFCNDLGVLPKIQHVSTQSECSDFLGIIKTAYLAEKDLLVKYKELSNMAISKDNSVFELSQWFVKEQVKSVGEYSDLLARIELANNNPSALLLIDQELSK